MLEVLVGVVSALIGIVVGIWLRDRHYKQQEARRKALAYARRVDTRRLNRAAKKSIPVASDAS